MSQRNESYTPKLSNRKGWRRAIRKVIKDNTPRHQDARRGDEYAVYVAMLTGPTRGGIQSLGDGSEVPPGGSNSHARVLKLLDRGDA